MSYDSLGIAQKRQNLKKALADYADYRGAQQLKGTQDDNSLIILEVHYLCHMH